MGQQLPLLDYREPTRLQARKQGAVLVLVTRGADREDALDAMVDALNHLDRSGVPVLALSAGAARWPTDEGDRYVFRYPMLTEERAFDAAALAQSWWAQRGAR
jgi:hypothetical protein